MPMTGIASSGHQSATRVSGHRLMSMSTASTPYSRQRDCARSKGAAASPAGSDLGGPASAYDHDEDRPGDGEHDPGDPGDENPPPPHIAFVRAADISLRTRRQRERRGELRRDQRRGGHVSRPIWMQRAGQGKLPQCGLPRPADPRLPAGADAMAAVRLRDAADQRPAVSRRRCPPSLSDASTLRCTALRRR
jgi:hypothetical protein